MIRLLCTCAIVTVVMGIRIQAQEKRDGAAVSRGKEIFQQWGGCHSAETDEKKMGQWLKGLFQEASYAMAKA